MAFDLDQERRRAAELLCLAGLEARADQIAALTQPAIGITEDESSACTSHFWGLPTGPTRPATAADGPEPLQFLAELDLAEVHPFDVDGVLPPTGRLRFWLCNYLDVRDFGFGQTLADRHNFRVTFTAAGDATPVPVWADPVGMDESATPVVFNTFLSWPALRSLEMDELGLTEEEREAYWRLGGFLRGFTDLLDDDDPLQALPLVDAPPEHLLLGHADPIQSDVRPSCAAMARGVAQGRQPTDDELWDESNGARDWRLLLQLGEGSSFVWGDGGALTYCLPADRLAAGDFDRCWFSWDCG